MKKALPLKYKNYCIALQEVPDEIPLIINISGCPYKCRGCHSKYLWEYKGNYIKDDLATLIDKYEGLISCVCFMGGDQNVAELNWAIDYVHSRGYKFCLYTGSNSIPIGLHLVEYLKIGSYKQECGGLDQPNTNQRYYKNIDGEYKDYTYIFLRKEYSYAKDNQKS